PSEADLFGAPASSEASPAPAPPPPAADGGGRDEAILGGARGAHPSGAISAAQENPLAIGGLAYLRALTTWNRGVPPSSWALSAPLLTDLYADARPNDRVRAYALGRLTYDPTVPERAVESLGGRAEQTRVQLDQLWLNFDVERKVFVTVGKQHVKWGTGRLWNPTDWLHPVRRDPLAQLDVRTGVTMVKAHVPWEARGWNLYGVLVVEDLAGRPGAGYATLTAPEPESPNALGHVGVGGRAETVWGPAEVGLDAVAQRGHKPRFGLDASFPLGALDVHGELALRSGKDAPRWTLRPGGDRRDLAAWQAGEWRRVTPAVMAGFEWAWKYSDEDLIRTGAEYFFDDAGYDDAHVYPVLLASPLISGDTRAAYTPFYIGRHYAGVFVNVPKPGSWNDTSFTLTVVANVSDGSGVVRLDHSALVNTYLTVETYVAGHVGKQGGELRFGGTIPPQSLLGTPSFTIPTAVLDLGVALRVTL
ncbi:MAG TPA: hypothetical protein VLT47_11390, partial [Anaeromyxobacteraceae bacterium]|nr:hypothetical protein [Anaeromyxobacteraceae bacterium]